MPHTSKVLSSIDIPNVPHMIDPMLQGTVVNRVLELRKRKGMTQQELADAVGVTRQTVISIEKGNYIPSVLLALKIATYFEVPVEQVFTFEK